MRDSQKVTQVRFTPARELDRQAGLLAFVSCEVDGLALDGLTLRRTTGGQLRVAFPTRRSQGGRRFAFVRPIDDAAEASITRQILDALKEHGATL